MENGRIECLASLNKIALSKEESACVRAFFEARARDEEILAAVDTEGIVPTVHVNPVPCVLREDEVVSGGSREALQSIATSVDAGSWCVPRVLE